MLEHVTLDQLRTFIAAAEAGSFSAAGRRLRRAQSVVSQTVANLEAQLGVRLFDRAHRYPQLTDAGRALLESARAVSGGLDAFRARAKGLAEGLEPELSVVVDVMFPMDVLTEAVMAFERKFPDVPLTLFVEALGAVIQPILDARCQFGVVGTLPLELDTVTTQRLLGVTLIMVASPRHPLANLPRPIPRPALRDHVQLVLTDRTELSRGRDFGVLSPKTWRLSDLGAKHAFLRAGLGWGGMPLSMVAADLERGALVELVIEDADPSGLIMPMAAAWRTGAPPGPAGRWLIGALQRSGEHGGERPESATRPE